MIIIGEKINGTLPHVREAIKHKDEDYIRKLALDQVEAGADYIDICAGTSSEVEVETLKWLMDIVQDAVDEPLCIDSPSPQVFEKVMNYAKKPGIINSVSEEKDKCDTIYPLVRGTDWQVIALTCNDHGIPPNALTRVEIAGRLVEKAQTYNIEPNHIFIDPLVLALSTNQDSLLVYLETMIKIKEIFPSIKATAGLSNISFGLPARRLVNQQFLSVALFSGLDSAIMDPCDRGLKATILTTQALKCEDKFCKNYLRAFRKGQIGPQKYK